MQNIVALLRQTIGLDAAAVGNSVQQSIRQRMQKTGIADEHVFLRVLQDCPEEMAALVEDVAVPETWFFRYREAFQLMQKHLSAISGGRVLRLLSMPCSTGEEPYSMAMTLLDMGLPPQAFHIDAVDISRLHLSSARRAIYRASSFRGIKDPDFRQRYFHQTDAGYVLSSRVRDCVSFHQGNILDHERLEKMGTYDVICCRNVLIYLDDEHRKRTVSLLAKMLRDDGILFVGHAETGLIWQELFHSIAAPMAFAFCRDRQEGDALSLSCRLSATSGRSRRVQKKEMLQPKPGKVDFAVPEAPKPASNHEPEPSLELASRLADQGKLEEARQQCETCLQQQGASAELWFLLGLISDIQERHQDAEAAFRKVLYLDPEHQEALTHLAFLLDKRGNSRAAQHLRDRFQRLHDRQQAGK
ncbi:MAG: CheR family methyltransferase [Mariprofundus sp.]